MTVSQLRELISEIIDEKIRALADPDYGLELREDLIETLQAQMNAVKNGERGASLDQVLEDLGIDASEIESNEEKDVPVAVS